MLIDGIELAEGSDVTNLTVATGLNFPANGSDGEFFLKSDAGVYNLYIYHSGSWNRVADEQSIQDTLGYTPVNKAGDTMTGALVLSGAPTLSLHAATKAYVDSVAGSGGASSFTVTGDVTGTLDGGTDVLTLAASGVTAGSYKQVTVNLKGIVTGGSNPTTLAGYGITDALSSSYVPSWASITGKPSFATVATSGLFADLNSKPTTLAGYGITDALNSSYVPSWSTITGKPTFATVATSGLYSDLTGTPAAYSLPTATNLVLGGVKPDGTTISNVAGVISTSASAIGLGNVEDKSSSTIRSEITSLNVTNALGFTPYNSTNPSGYISANQAITVSGDVTGSGTTSLNLTLANTAVTAGSYGSATQTATYSVNSKGQLILAGNVTITPAWSSITSKPTTLSGYGITDAQALDADLTAIAALAGTTGFLKKTAANTWALDTSVYGTGTVTSVSFANGNGFTGSIATNTTTPAITVGTSISGMLKGLTGAVVGASPGIDYSVGTSALATGILKNTNGGGASSLSIAIAADFPILNQNTTGNAQTASQAVATNITDDTTTNTTVFPTWVSTSSGAAGQKTSSSKLTFNPSTGNLSSTTFSGALAGNASSASYSSAVSVAADAATASSVYPLWVNATTGNIAPKVSGGLSYVPSTSTLTATTFSGALAGNASSASVASTVTTTADTATGTAVYPVWTTATSGNLAHKTSGGLSYVPSTGALTATSFVGALNGNANSANRATNISGGLIGSIPYQTAANTTALLAAGTAGQILTSNGAAAPSWQAPTVGAAAAGTLTGTALAANVVSSSLTSLGTVVGLTVANTIRTPDVTGSTSSANITIQAGSTVTGNAGAAILRGAQTAGANAGKAFVIGGTATTTGAGGDVIIDGGVGGTGGAGGAVNITGGAGENQGGAITILGGTYNSAVSSGAGNVTLQGGNTSNTGQTAAHAYVVGGQSTGQGGKGGNAVIQGGIGSNFSGGYGGAIIFSTAPTNTLVERIRILNSGAISFGSSGTAIGNAGQVLMSNGNAAPSWTNTPALPGLTLTGVKNTIIDKGTIGTGTVTFDFAAGNVQRLQVGGALTITVTNWPASGNRGYMTFKLVNAGSAAITITPTINWVKPDGTFTTSIATYMTAIGRTGLQSAGTDHMVWWTDDAGTTIYGKMI